MNNTYTDYEKVIQSLYVALIVVDKGQIFI